MSLKSPSHPVATQTARRPREPRSRQTPHNSSLTPLEYALPRPLLNSKQFAPISPIFSTLTATANLSHSKAFEPPLLATLTSHPRVSPLECALTKMPRGGTPPPGSPARIVTSLPPYFLTSLSAPRCMR